MRKRIIISLLTVLVISISIAEITTNYFKNINGAPPGYSGAPQDTGNCSHCHTDTDGIIDTVDWMSSDAFTNGYFHGSYLINLSVPGTGIKGFEVSAVDSAGNPAGFFYASANTQLVGDNRYITHLSGGSDNPQQWDFNWDPILNSWGPVTFYASYLVDSGTVCVEKEVSDMQSCDNCHGINEYKFITGDIDVKFSTSSIGIRCNSNSVFEVFCSIYNTAGQCLVNKYPAFLNVGENNIAIDRPGTMQQGEYILNIQSISGNRSKKFIIY